MKKTFFLAALFVGISAMAVSESEVIYQGASLNPRGPELNWANGQVGAFLATHQESYVQRWSDIGAQPAPPAVDFSKYSVLFVSRYFHPYVGKNLQLLAVKTQADRSVVNIATLTQVGCYESVGEKRDDLVVVVAKKNLPTFLRMSWQFVCKSFPQGSTAQDFDIPLVSDQVTSYRK